jgi:hypothetical protein
VSRRVSRRANQRASRRANRLTSRRANRPQSRPQIRLTSRLSSHNQRVTTHSICRWFNDKQRLTHPLYSRRLYSLREFRVYPSSMGYCRSSNISCTRHR